jgi:hypothetical protein
MSTSTVEQSSPRLDAPGVRQLSDPETRIRNHQSARPLGALNPTKLRPAGAPTEVRDVLVRCSGCPDSFTNLTRYTARTMLPAIPPRSNCSLFNRLSARLKQR